MKLFKTIRNKYDESFMFFETGRSSDRIGVLRIFHDQSFESFIIHHEDYLLYINDNKEEDLFYILDSDPRGEFSTISGYIKDGLFTFESVGSLNQEYFDMPTFKFEFAMLLNTIQSFYLPVKDQDLLSIECIYDESIYFTKKVIQRTSPTSFKSLLTNKEYSFVLDPTYEKDLPDVRNWIVNDSNVNVWIAPIKDYITINTDLDKEYSVADLTDIFLLKQFAALLTIETAPIDWVKSGYVQRLSKYLDPILLVNNASNEETKQNNNEETTLLENLFFLAIHAARVASNHSEKYNYIQEAEHLKKQLNDLGFDTSLPKFEVPEM